MLMPSRTLAQIPSDRGDAYGMGGCGTASDCKVATQAVPFQRQLPSGLTAAFH